MDTNEIILHKIGVWEILIRQVKNPLLLVLAVATTASFFLGERTNAIIIFLMMFGSVLLGFWNEYSAERTVNDLLKKISLMAVVIRNGVKQEVPVGSLKNKETVLLFPGAIIPADLVIQGCDGLEVDESPLTGESFPVVRKEGDKVFMGTIVTKGSAHGEIIAIGKSTRMGKLSLELANVRP